MDDILSSENQIRADNQQGRLDPQWIVGFVDGEGCFSVSILRNSTTKLGVQVFPEFVVTQGAKSLSVLEDIQEYFQCGNIYENRRTDNHKENLYRFCERNVNDISTKIVPFFEQHKLRTAKQHDFVLFCKVIKAILNKEHLSIDGVDQIKLHAANMNRRKTRI